jgi:glycine betaine/proline transport system ATP-binding protein
MNPLNVLRGTSVMTPASKLRRSDDEVLIGAGQIRVRVDDEERPVAVTLDGHKGKLASADGATGTVPAKNFDMIVAPVDLTLRAAIALKQQTDYPILLVDQLGRLAGLCGDEEIYRSLLRRR